MIQLSEKLEQITDYINKNMTEQTSTGLSVAIVKDGDIVYSKGFGLSRLQPDRPIDGDTLMSIQSISKNFAALSIMQLVEEVSFRWTIRL